MLKSEVNDNNVNKIWDVIVIGGGPAGMMAAGRAAERDKSVLLLEKNPSLGKKLLITGGGRCNVTNYTLENNLLVASYEGRPKALFSVFTQFDVKSTLEFFNSRGMETKIENEGRVFPLSNKAESVWEVLNDYLRFQKVNILTDCKVSKISVENNSGNIIVATNNQELKAKSCVVATGGTSHPETGSTGDGFRWLRNLGHTIIDNNFALVPIAIKDLWVKKLSGVALQDIKVTVIQEDKKLDSRVGKLLFTHVGISGPAVLNLSSKVGDLLQYGEVTLEIDLLPEVDQVKLNSDLLELFQNDINKMIKNTLSKYIPSTLVQIVIELAGIDPEKPNHSITKEERAKLIKILKGISLHVKGLLGADKAIVSSGGVKIEEVDFKTMRSKLVPNLFIVGDMLNIRRPSGGYSLQLCWATGFVAGDNC